MISSLAQEIAKWVAEHHGVRPKLIRVSQAALDACAAELKILGMYQPDIERRITKILGIPVLADPTLTIGKIDP